MRKICIIGAEGFIGKNLRSTVAAISDIELTLINRFTPDESYDALLKNCDVVFHFAGVNRSKDPADFVKVNVELTRKVAGIINQTSKKVKFVYSSSQQASLNNPYGVSKLNAEHVIEEAITSELVSVYNYRLHGVFGKWSKPNYNTVVATFCYNVIHDIPLSISDPSRVLELIYIDDVINEFIKIINTKNSHFGFSQFTIKPIHKITLQKLAEAIRTFRETKSTLEVPSFKNPLIKKLYATYVSFLPLDQFSYDLTLREDNRGHLFEWIKSKYFGQIFISTTKPGITRGNHFHHTKSEKFLVISGTAEIKFLDILTNRTVSYFVSGSKPKVVDIPTGYAHNITNIGNNDLITLFWADEIFEPDTPDTYFHDIK